MIRPALQDYATSAIYMILIEWSIPWNGCKKGDGKYERTPWMKRWIPSVRTYRMWRKKYDRFDWRSLRRLLSVPGLVRSSGLGRTSKQGVRAWEMGISRNAAKTVKMRVTFWNPNLLFFGDSIPRQLWVTTLSIRWYGPGTRHPDNINLSRDITTTAEVVPTNEIRYVRPLKCSRWWLQWRMSGSRKTFAIKEFINKVDWARRLARSGEPMYWEMVTLSIRPRSGREDMRCAGGERF